MAFENTRIRELKPLSFIYELPRALPADLCREAIRRFEASAAQHLPGRIGAAAEEAPQVKRSTDLRLSGREDWQDIDQALARQLAAVVGAFAREFPFFAANSFKDLGYNLQRTRPGEYYHWHVDGGPGEFGARQLVAIWYLNDVPGPGGETEFPLQEVAVRPEEGKLLLFPPFWTHVHRGVTLREGVKYIATTWICFA
ncbi:MAG TPA: 2OG-Fe(II) oxygenase [Burkholderiales bacterium]|nr:2OG-Fe(II) oxygenase [Burkholderiales bacterium]